MAESIKKKSVKGILWSGIEKVAYELIQFVVSIVLARLLTPHDYGAIGLLMVFIVFSQLFIDGGLSTALIQKKERNEGDYNTVFWFNLSMSVLLYTVIFFIAPWVAQFYEMPELKPLLRLLALTLIISPFSSIQVTQLTIRVDFKRISIASIPSHIVSGAIGIYMAYHGFGAYALVAQQVSMALIRCVLLNIFSNYRIRLFFSKESFKDMFSFSFKLVLASSLDRIYTSIYTMVIGKVFNPSVLGLYSRGTHFAKLPANILGDIFNRVTLPVMSSLQDNPERLRGVFRKYIQGSSSIIFATLICLLLCAKPLVLLLLTEKWIEAVPILQLMCLAFLTNHISAINRNVLYTKKRSDLALKLEVIKKAIALSIFVVSLYWGIIGVCVGQILYGAIAVVINSLYTKDLIGVSVWQQIKDFGGQLIICAIAAIPSYLLTCGISSNILRVLITCSLFIASNVLLNVCFKTYPYLEGKDILFKTIGKLKNKHIEK